MRDPAFTAASRLRLALDLFRTGEELQRQRLRRKHPVASEADIERRMDEWMMRRPGAEDGDRDGDVSGDVKVYRF